MNNIRKYIDDNRRTSEWYLQSRRRKAEKLKPKPKVKDDE